MPLHTSQRGQASIEYMLVSSAFLAIVLLVLPAASGLSESISFALDSFAAKSFSVSLESAVSEAMVLDNGTVISLRARPAGEWIVSASGGNFSVLPSYGKRKLSSPIIARIPQGIYLENRFIEGEFGITVSKTAYGVSLEYS